MSGQLRDWQVAFTNTTRQSRKYAIREWHMSFARGKVLFANGDIRGRTRIDVVSRYGQPRARHQALISHLVLFRALHLLLTGSNG
jgi:hypothetical protein